MIFILGKRIEGDSKKINGRFLRQELFAINKQFEN